MYSVSSDWIQRELSEISDKVTQKNNNRKYNLTLTNSATRGIISQTDYFDKQISNPINLDGYYVVSDNDFVYNPRISLNAPFGPINRNTLGITGIMSPLYYVFTPKNINLNFLEFYFKTTKWHKFMYQNGDTGARSDRFSISNKLLETMPIKIPGELEQDYIGKMLTVLEKTITLEQEKLAQYKLVYLALIQKFLISDSSTGPEIRIENHHQSWALQKVSDIFKITRGNVLAKSKVMNKKDSENIYPVFSSQTKDNGLMGYYNKYLFENAITWTTDGANAGTVTYRRDKFYSTNVNGVLLSEEGYASEVVALILNNTAYKYVSYVGNPKLMNNVMADIKIYLPTDMLELEKLDKIFIEYKHTLKKMEQKIIKHKIIKENLLQNLFV